MTPERVFMKLDGEWSGVEPSSGIDWVSCVESAEVCNERD